MQIHFVCMGNAYRSRLAEACLNSKKIPNVTVSSSGVKRDYHYEGNGPVTWYGMRLLKNHQLIPFMSHMSIQATEKELNSVDLVIFFKDETYEYAKNHLNFTGKNYRIWDISDVDQFSDDDVSLEVDIKRMEATAETFEKIKQHVDKLITEEHLA